MTRRATFTRAELDRALAVAEKHGKTVEIVAGRIRLVEPGAASGVSSDSCDIDKAFGCDT